MSVFNCRFFSAFQWFVSTLLVETRMSRIAPSMYKFLITILKVHFWNNCGKIKASTTCSISCSSIVYVTCFVIINQLILWDPSVNYYFISRRQGSASNPMHSASWHHLSGAVCLQLRKVSLPSPLSRHIWKLVCSLLHTTRSPGQTFLLLLVPLMRILNTHHHL